MDNESECTEWLQNINDLAQKVHWDVLGRTEPITLESIWFQCNIMFSTNSWRSDMEFVDDKVRSMIEKLRNE